MKPHPKPEKKTKGKLRKADQTVVRGRLKKVRKSPYQHPAWKKLRTKVFARAGNVCEVCRAQPAHHAHHVAYGKGRGWRRLIVPMTKLLAVCRDCHNRIHPLNWKGEMLTMKMSDDFLEGL